MLIYLAMVNLKRNGEYMALSGAFTGSNLFDDERKTISTLSKELAGSYLVQLSWNDVRSSSFSVSCSKDCSVIIAIWKGKSNNAGSDDQWKNPYLTDGWILKKEQKLKWQEKHHEPGETKGVISKTISANYTLFFKKIDDGLPITMFVIQGKKKYSRK